MAPIDTPAHTPASPLTVPAGNDLDDDDTVLDSPAMDDQPTHQFAHAKTRDSSTKKLNSANYSYDESVPGTEPQDESFSLFADVQPQLPKLSAPDSINELPRTTTSKTVPGFSLSSTVFWVLACTLLGGVLAFLVNW